MLVKQFSSLLCPSPLASPIITSPENNLKLRDLFLLIFSFAVLTRVHLLLSVDSLVLDVACFGSLGILVPYTPRFLFPLENRYVTSLGIWRWIHFPNVSDE